MCSGLSEERSQLEAYGQICSETERHIAKIGRIPGVVSGGMSSVLRLNRGTSTCGQNRDRTSVEEMCAVFAPSRPMAEAGE